MRKSIAIIMIALLSTAGFGLIPNLVGADTQFQGLWVRMRGIITEWGSTRVFGWISVYTKMVNKNGTYNEWAQVRALWSYDHPKLNCTTPPTETFTFSVYGAKLIETTDVALNYSGYNFYVSGRWNVFKVNITVNINENGEVISIIRSPLMPVVINVTGELRVFNNWRGFELSIEGIDLLQGFIQMWFFKWVEVKICDLDDDGDVDLIDLVKVAKRYNLAPGLPNYEMDMDFNFDYKIDIGDLTTLAANMG